MITALLIQKIFVGLWMLLSLLMIVVSAFDPDEDAKIPFPLMLILGPIVTGGFLFLIYVVGCAFYVAFAFLLL